VPKTPPASRVARRLHTLGWREWVALPDLEIAAVKAKLDTGARSSALHAFFVERFREGSEERVRFGMHPLQNRSDPEVICEADLLDEREVVDSGGHREVRCFIRTRVSLAGETWEIEASLTDRETMRYRMLLGRRALAGRAVVDPSLSYLAGDRRTDRGGSRGRRG
jgi:hypothetical protein